MAPELISADLHFLLGQIVSRLATNDKDHEEIKEMLKETKATFEKCTKDLVVDVTTLKTKASTWGGIAGFIAGAIMTIIGWLVYKH